ncbi:PREDICTED: probable tyrosine-protein phosphatase F54C8.4 [Nicrophorus vespilloides]|uniref:Probable tyrosine-protein phosphatase F54C8.4 n=1 Tax=Nicrophorus vespilloides TaxID=110193 RepID=A0ABM1NHC4_NICVS|nr:PREDICTED: probable tyrosine-protein phosphatase F54C8.4 [Nicrophorus vespilloides]
MSKVPKGWMDYSDVGNQVPGTRFISFKVPLKQSICWNTFREDKRFWFTPDILMEKVPKLRMIINLTNTDDGRYYTFKDFTDHSIEVHSLKCLGHGNIPQRNFVKRFYQLVDQFLKRASVTGDVDGLIGVHCTHGLNRTGYFICKYMVEMMGIDARRAIRAFEESRGHRIIRQMYIDDIMMIQRNPQNNRDDAREQR